MQQYRLLRNNKESGPYTWKELAHLPLKPYDLVWVDGKSAAWRYPSELPEFKEVAPRVEEDFYEQFHRRPAEKKEAAATVSSGITEKAEVTSAPVTSEIVSNVASGTASAPTELRKKVAVILPESVPPPKQEPVLRVVKKEPSPILDKEQERSNVIPGPDPVIDQLQIPQPKKAKQKTSIKPLYWAAGVAGIVALTWILIQSSNGNHPAITEPDPSALPVLQTAGSIDASTDLPTALPENPALEFAALKRFLSVSPDQINVGMFGGINKLQLTIKNNHTQPIENIVIAVDFLEKDQSLHHTEIVEVTKIEPQSTLSVRVPANGKGRAVQTRILGIGKYKP